jgi:hypothetical protein
MFNPQAEQIIRQELLRSGRRFTEKRRDFATVCINPSCPSLDDPSKRKLEIKKDGSQAHCWVCDWSGSWDTFAKSQGLQTINSKTRGFSKESYYSTIDLAEHIHKQLLVGDEDNLDETPGTLPAGLIPWAQYTNQPWRGLSVEFLTSLGARFWNHTHKNYTTPRILLPFYQRGELVGYTGRRLDAEKMLKYCNAPWAVAKKILYPYDYIAAMSPKAVCLVEGQIDALNLIQSGIPALCILGTNNWSDNKRSELMRLNVDRVYVCMDGDPAGRMAAAKLFHGTEDHGPITGSAGGGCLFFDHVENISLPDGVDPGSLAPDQIAWLKSYIGVV